jgi:hypothetical protein
MKKKKVDDGQFLPTQVPFIRQTSIKISIPLLTNETHPKLLLRAPVQTAEVTGSILSSEDG